MLHLHHTIEAVKERIEAALRRADREGDSVTLVAVTKNVPLATIEAARQCGLHDFGESRIQEASDKVPFVPGQNRWHLIGTLQRNKVRHALRLFDLLHSVDRVSLVEEISRRAGDDTIDVLLQVNVSGEASKHGVSPKELFSLAEAASNAGNIRVRGLMTMAPYADDPRLSRPYFAQLREMKNALQRLGLPRVEADYLSMGMSNDFEVAIEEGATHVRIGTALFDK